MYPIYKWGYIPYTTETHRWPSPGLSDPVGRSGFAPEDRPEERLEDLGGPGVAVQGCPKKH